ncbi:unnamed protein product, partial [Gongylonema pulchrum]|uniref:Uncharacterized protein n=1 Tax=Gongylonema pulchrum TaxID=637853 RepID=A0A183DGU3_9BILA
MQRQAQEAESDRKEALTWQNKLIRVQQDRNDAQERLRVCMKETEAAQAELEEAHKQLRMKDIYLRQLGAYTGATAPTATDTRNFS